MPGRVTAPPPDNFFGINAQNRVQVPRLRFLVFAISSAESRDELGFCSLV